MQRRRDERDSLQAYILRELGLEETEKKYLIAYLE
jgi:hypothetical protein